MKTAGNRAKKREKEEEERGRGGEGERERFPSLFLSPSLLSLSPFLSFPYSLLFLLYYLLPLSSGPPIGFAGKCHRLAAQRAAGLFPALD